MQHLRHFPPLPQADLNECLTLVGEAWWGSSFAMMTVAILSMFFGAALGLRFKVLVLVPAILVSLALNAGIAAAQGSDLWPTLIAMALSIIGIQVGFLGGISARFFIIARRPPHVRAPRAAQQPRPALPAEG
jgi:hypothetical protein